MTNTKYELFSTCWRLYKWPVSDKEVRVNSLHSEGGFPRELPFKRT